MKTANMAGTSPAIQEAMKLMQAGRLREATTLLQNGIKGETVTATADDATTSYTANAQGFSGMSGLMDKISQFKPDLSGALDMGSFKSSGGREAIPENAQFISQRLSHAQGTRDYLLYIPSDYQQQVEQGKTLPLVIMLHGCTQSAEDFSAGTQMNQLAEKHACLIAYPIQPASANQNRCWNWFQPADQQAGRGEPALLAAITQTIIQDYAVDVTRVYISGLSAGAAMAVIMAETYPELYAAVGVHSGLAYRSATDLSSALMAMSQGSTGYGSPAAGRFVPTIVFHGDKDTTVAPRNGEQVFKQAKQRLQAQSIETTEQQDTPSKRSASRTYFSDNAGNIQLEHWRVHGAGHAWAGGSSNGSYTDPTGPDASTEMLRFFLSHQN